MRSSGLLDIQTGGSIFQGIGYQHDRVVYRSQGYEYIRIARFNGEAGFGHTKRAALSLPGINAEVSRAI